MRKRNWLLAAVTGAMLMTAIVAAPRSAVADDDDQVGVALDADGDGRPDDADGDGVPDKTTQKSWKDLAKCGISRASAGIMGGWVVAGLAAFSCLLD